MITEGGLRQTEFIACLRKWREDGKVWDNVNSKQLVEFSSQNETFYLV